MWFLCLSKTHTLRGSIQECISFTVLVLANRIEKNHPDYRTVICDLMHMTGVKSLELKSKREDLDFIMLTQIREDPIHSIRSIRLNTAIPKTRVAHILKRQLLELYHIQCIPADYHQRVRLCGEKLRTIRADLVFFNSILRTDDSNFRRTRLFSVQILLLGSRKPKNSTRK